MAVHKWKLLDTVQVDGTNFFLYACKRCQYNTRNGQPLPKPYDKECVKRNTFGKLASIY